MNLNDVKSCKRNIVEQRSQVGVMQKLRHVTLDNSWPQRVIYERHYWTFILKYLRKKCSYFSRNLSSHWQFWNDRIAVDRGLITWKRGPGRSVGGKKTFQMKMNTPTLILSNKRYMASQSCHTLRLLNWTIFIWLNFKRFISLNPKEKDKNLN